MHKERVGKGGSRVEEFKMVSWRTSNHIKVRSMDQGMFFFLHILNDILKKILNTKSKYFSNILFIYWWKLECKHA